LRVPWQRRSRKHIVSTDWKVCRIRENIIGLHLVQITALSGFSFDFPVFDPEITHLSDTCLRWGPNLPIFEDLRGVGGNPLAGKGEVMRRRHRVNAFLISSTQRMDIPWGIDETRVHSGDRHQ
jgi:hypothetical protein